MQGKSTDPLVLVQIEHGVVQLVIIGVLHLTVRNNGGDLWSIADEP